MKQKQTLLICDGDERYVSSLAEYMNSRQYLMFQAEPFTDPACIQAYLKTAGYVIMLTGMSLYEQLIADSEYMAVQENVYPVLLLEREPEDKPAIPWVRKYQSADRLIRQIMDLYAQGTVETGAGLPEHSERGASGQESTEQLPSVQKMSDIPEQDTQRHSQTQLHQADHANERKSLYGSIQGAKQNQQTDVYAELPQMPENNVQLLAVYSPIGRCGKTSFAITLGEQLACSQHVLYLNMEDCSGFRSLNAGQGEGDLSDLLYFSRIPGGSLLYKMNAMIRTWDRLDYIPPVFSCMDLRELNGMEWCSFLRRLAAEGEYDCIILDIGTQIQDVFQLLQLCEEIFIPVLDDPASKGKLRQFTENLETLGGRGLREKIHYLQLPSPGRDERSSRLKFPENITRGKMGDYVKRMLKSR